MNRLGLRVRVETEYGEFAFVGLHETRCKSQQCRLARAVRADERGQLAVPRAEGNMRSSATIRSFFGRAKRW